MEHPTVHTYGPLDELETLAEIRNTYWLVDTESRTASGYGMSVYGRYRERRESVCHDLDILANIGKGDERYQWVKIRIHDRRQRIPEGWFLYGRMLYRPARFRSQP